MELRVLNHGIVKLIDHMGDDKRVVDSARVSYGDGTKKTRSDSNLIDYLLRNEHTSPFEQVNFTFYLKMPIFVARQHVRHRTGRINEISGRYSEMKDDFFIPDSYRIQSVDNKQASEFDNSIDPNPMKQSFGEEQLIVYNNYINNLNGGMARELARINLPISIYTEMYWNIDLHNLMHYLKLRMHEHAQYEIRVYAEAMYELCKEICPITFESFENHVLNSIKFSGREWKYVEEFFIKRNDDFKTYLSDGELKIVRNKLMKKMRIKKK
jgi:thymidylate synthase (FAD)